MYNLFTLNNGLKVVVENIEHFNSVSVGLWVENGSRNENSINNGASHFIEHMLFKGTANRNSKEIAEDIENVGGQINAFTGKEATCYYIKTLDTHLELGLELLSDMLFNSLFNEEDIEKEKGVIIEEINMSEDSAEDVLMDLHAEAVWGKDGLSLPILGTENTVKSFNKEIIVSYLKSYYIPENCVISICGKIDMKNIEKIVEKYFGNWQYDNKNITMYSAPEILNNNYFRRKDIEQLHINLGMPGLEIGHDDLYTLILLSNMLGGGAASILFQKIREELGICYSIYLYMSSHVNNGLVNVYAGLNPKYIKEAIDVILNEVNKFSKENITNEKLQKSKEQLKGNYILGLESTSSRMFSNGKSVLFLNKINTPSDVIKKIDKIDMDSVERVKELTFRKGIQNSAFVGKDIRLLKEIYKDNLTEIKK
ncbi:processing protease [Clostridium argentinense CDC 2741]|uniref:Processing protease n=1 Tax=Clostridium argentinense CDC 2741 TaxID=1418104 RepID=A0A0C1U2A6_9CLOT|nr:pitrilysin family protein [Clostridium argentinense]ARC85598.1 peptidase M16 [Clostridium argentinense]KIE46974.1 processing protease [Clostridium argentinense CDC 2741]NFF40114.1 insulinase family protein [Clostridium argentinense]NFP52505.1 insulinase family protein [Clostridium argentinense]NFP73028.1 insulinase family protein [Clostridium argentinense]